MASTTSVLQLPGRADVTEDEVGVVGVVTAWRSAKHPSRTFAERSTDVGELRVPMKRWSFWYDRFVFAHEVGSYRFAEGEIHHLHEMVRVQPEEPAPQPRTRSVVAATEQVPGCA